MSGVDCMCKVICNKDNQIKTLIEENKKHKEYIVKLEKFIDVLENKNCELNVKNCVLNSKLYQITNK